MDVNTPVHHSNDFVVNSVLFFMSVVVIAFIAYGSQIKPGSIPLPPSISRYMRKRRTMRVCARHSFQLNTGELAVIDNANCEICNPKKPEPRVPPTPPKNCAWSFISLIIELSRWVTEQNTMQAKHL